MGCFVSTNRDRSSAYRVKDGHTESPHSVLPWEQADRLDPADFAFRDLQTETKIKTAGSINGQQFIIDACVGCQLYLFDVSATISVEDCTDCRILIGPVDGSLFINNCKNCTIVAVCRQFRTRDCHGCTCKIHCCTKPIIESSSKMLFGCCDIAYRGLTEQMQSIKLSKFQNFWSDVYDFTPTADSRNWEFAAEDLTGINLLDPLPTEAHAIICEGASEAVVITHGERPSQHLEPGFLCVLFSASASDAAIALLQKVKLDLQDIVPKRTNDVKFDDQACIALQQGSTGDASGASQIQPGAYIGIELLGALVSCDAAELLARDAGALLVSRQAKNAEPFRFAGLA